MRKFFLWVFLFPWVLMAQPFKEVPFPLLGHFPFFHSGYIQKHGVKQIVSSVMIKDEMEVLEHLPSSQKWHFSVVGRLVQYEEVNAHGHFTQWNYTYNLKGLLAGKIQTQNGKKAKTSYTYNSDGLVTKILTTGDFELNNGEENFTYETFSPTQYKKYFLNNEGLTYKYMLVTHKGPQILATQTRYIRGVNRSYVNYTYQGNKLKSVSRNEKQTTRREQKSVLNYDELDRLISIDRYVDGAHTLHTELLYNGEVVTAILEKEISTKRIKITKLTYTYY